MHFCGSTRQVFVHLPLLPLESCPPALQQACQQAAGRGTRVHLPAPAVCSPQSSQKPHPFACPPDWQVLERNNLEYPFPPMPAEKRQEVLAWRAEEDAKKAARQAQQQAQQQVQQQAEEAPAGRHKKLRRAGELEQEALRDEMEDGSPPAATLGTQRHKRKQQQVLSDSDSEEEDSEDSRPLALRVAQQQQHQQRTVLRTPVAQLAADSEDSPPSEQQQQPKKQRPGPCEA